MSKIAFSLSDFEIRMGSVVGQGHVKSGIPCQDKVAGEKRFSYYDHLLGVLMDGCTSSANSHEGAWRLAFEIKEAVRFNIGSFVSMYDTLLCSWKANADRATISTSLSLFVEHVADVICQRLVRFMVDNARDKYDTLNDQVEYIRSTYLATGQVILMFHNIAIYFGWGDGIYWFGDKDSKHEVVDQNNKPQYLAYRAMIELDKTLTSKVGVFVPTNYRAQWKSIRSLEYALLATDGGEPFTTQVSGFYLSVPAPVGIPDRVGSLRQFYTDDIYLDDPQALQKRLDHLVTVNRYVREGDPKNGNIDRPFHDDVGILMIRKHK